MTTNSFDVPMTSPEIDEVTSCPASVANAGAFLDRDVIISYVEQARSNAPPRSTTRTMREYLGSFAEPEPGKHTKEGKAYLQGAVKAGNARTNASMETMEVIAYDIDGGDTPEAVRDRAQQAGFEVVIHPTFNDGKTETRVAADKVMNWANRQSRWPRLSPSDQASEEQVLTYVQEELGILPDVLNGAQVRGREGHDYVLEHKPLRRFRVIVPLLSRVALSDLASAFAGVQAAWKAVYRHIAKTLGISSYDTSCENLARIFYGHRRAKGAPSWHYRVSGKPVEFMATLMEAQEATQAPRPAARPDIESGKRFKSSTYKTLGLREFVRDNWSGFEAARFILERGDDPHDAGDKVTARCPNDQGSDYSSGHSSEDPPGARPLVAFDPQRSSTRGPVIACQHTHCKDDLKGPHYVDLICRAHNLEVSDLQAYVVDPRQVAEEAKQKIKDRIDVFTSDTPAAEIEAAIQEIAELDEPLFEEDVLKAMHTNTRRTKKTLDKAISKARKQRRLRGDTAAGSKSEAEFERYAEQCRQGLPVELQDWAMPHADLGRFVIKPHLDQYYLSRVISGGGGIDSEPWFTPIAIEARARFHGGKEGLRLRLFTSEGVTFVDFTGSEAVVGGGNELVASLRERGVGLTPAGTKHVKEWMLSTTAVQTVNVVAKPGWHLIDGENAYVSPLGEVFASGEHPTIELKRGGPITKRARGGTREGAMAVADTVLQQGCDYMKIGLLAGPAAAIVNLAELRSFTIYFGGETSKGKSTSQKLKASAWGPAKLNAGLFRTSRSTANGCEVLIEQGDGCGTDLDETKAMHGKDVEDLIFTIAGGKGKDRQSKNDNTNRDAKIWRGTCVSLSGELSVVQKIEAENRAMAGGTVARTMIIDVGQGARLERDVMERIEACEVHYGWAGPAVVEQLIGHGYDRAPHLLAERVADLGKCLAGAEPTELESRTAHMYAVVWLSGILLQEAQYLSPDLDIEALVRGQWEARKAVDREDGKSVSERALDVLRRSILSAELAGTVGNDVIVDPKSRKTIAVLSCDTYCIPLDAIGDLVENILDKKAVSSELRKRGALILPNDKTRNYHRSMPDGARLPHLRVKADFFKGDDEGNPHDAGAPFRKAYDDVVKEEQARQESDRRKRAGLH